MSKFRLVILDNAKDQLENPIAKKIMSDVVFVKQQNFLRSEPNYVVTDKHDMIGTHYLIYDTTSFLEPKLIFAIRTTFMTRAERHRIDTPLMSLIPRLEKPLQEAFNKFQTRHGDLIDCNAWFVDQAYSKKNAGLNLSDLGYLMVCTHVLRIGGDHIAGCTNEKFNASRWLENMGSAEKGLIFEHPAVKAPHMLMLLENFNLGYFGKVYQEYKDLVNEVYEVFPATTKTIAGDELTSFANFSAKLYGETTQQAELKVA